MSETLVYSSYIIEVERPSKFDPGATVHTVLGMRCPRCKTELPKLDHSKTQRCHGCGLNMQVFGNALEVW